jgi:hypothetical protein
MNRLAGECASLDISHPYGPLQYAFICALIRNVQLAAEFEVLSVLNIRDHIYYFNEENKINLK